MNELPNPLTPADCDLTGYRWMPLDVERVIDSDTFGLSTGDEFKTAFRLWAKSWKQVPAASLPNDERLLAHLAGIDVSVWRKRRDVALRGWILCSDGRLYHPVIAEKAIESMGKREQHNEREENKQTRQERYRERRKALFEALRERGIVPSKDVKTEELERLLASHSVTPSVTKSVTGDVTRNVTDDAPATAIEKDNDTTGPDITGDLKPETPGTVIAGGITPRGASDDSTPKNAADWLRYFRDRHGVELDATSLHDRKKAWPLFTAWVNAGVSIAQMDAAVAKAKAEAKGPIAFLPGYADAVLASLSRPATAARLNPDEHRRAISDANGAAWLAGDTEDPNVIDMES